MLGIGRTPEINLVTELWGSSFIVGVDPLLPLTEVETIVTNTLWLQSWPVRRPPPLLFSLLALRCHPPHHVQGTKAKFPPFTGLLNLQTPASSCPLCAHTVALSAAAAERKLSVLPPVHCQVPARPLWPCVHLKAEWQSLGSAPLPSLYETLVKSVHFHRLQCLSSKMKVA